MRPLTGAIIVAVAGVLVSATGILGWLGRLPRDTVAGVRTPATRRSERAFVESNKAAAPLVITGGMVAVAGGVLALLLPAQDRAGLVVVTSLGMGVLAVLGGRRGIRVADDL